jgi:site-specific recombinase XerD
MTTARERGRYGHRDATMILIAYRHGLRASELCSLPWDQMDFSRGLLHVQRLKNGTPSVPPMGGIEIRALRWLKREQLESRQIFLTERRTPMTTAGCRKMIPRISREAEFPFSVHPHMLRHACVFKLANDGQDTRALQHYLGHKNIQHTVRYTELSPKRFESFSPPEGLGMASASRHGRALVSTGDGRRADQATWPSRIVTSVANYPLTYVLPYATNSLRILLT